MALPCPMGMKAMGAASGRESTSCREWPPKMNPNRPLWVAVSALCRRTWEASPDAVLDNLLDNSA